MSIIFPEFLPFMLGAILYHLVYLPYFKHEVRWESIRKVYWNQENGKFNTFALVVLLLRSVNTFILPMCLTLLTYFCREVNMSPAVAQSFTALSSFMTAVGFYFSYGVRLTLQHVAGMLMIMGSVSVVAVAKSLQHSSERTSVDGTDETLTELTGQSNSFSFWYTMIPYLVAFITCIFLTMGSYFSRLARAAGYPPM